MEITNKNLEEIISLNKPMLIDFLADWCGPCRMLSPIIEQIESEYSDKIIVGKVNVDEQIELTEQYGIRNIPTILFIKNGEVVNKLIGMQKKETIVEIINDII